MTAARSAPAHDLAVTDGAGNGCGVAGTRPGAVAVVLGEQRDRPRHERAYIFHVLSGLLECGTCGDGFTIIDSANYGCATRRPKGTGTSDRKIRREEFERRVLDGLKHRLLAPELVEAFARAFQEEVNRLCREVPGAGLGTKVVSKRSGARSRA